MEFHRAFEGQHPVKAYYQEPAICGSKSSPSFRCRKRSLLPFESPVEIVLQEFAWAEAIHRETLNVQVWSRDNE